MGIQEHPTEKVYTYIVSNQKLYDSLSKKTKQGLQEAIYIQNKPTSYSNDTYFKPFLRPLLVIDKEKGPIFKLRATDTDEIEPTKKFGDEYYKLGCDCYKELKEKRDLAAATLSEKILLKKGDILVIDNHRTIHTRDTFTAYLDGTDRMILRVYVNPHS